MRAKEPSSVILGGETLLLLQQFGVSQGYVAQNLLASFSLPSLQGFLTVGSGRVEQRSVADAFAIVKNLGQVGQTLVATRIRALAHAAPTKGDLHGLIAPPWTK